jgi:uncharacterized membrane protein
MATYTIIGGDNKEYGPISAADIRQWIAEGRLGMQTPIRNDADTDTAWCTLGQLPEFADAFKTTAPPPIGALPGSAPAFPSASPMNFLERDYELDIMGCFSGGWDLLKDNFGVLWVAALVYLVIELAAGMLGYIPIIGGIFSLANFVISGALMGGLLYLYVRVNRGEPATVGDMFAGFSKAFGHLFLAVLVQGLLCGICLIPVLAVGIAKFMPLITQLKNIQPGTPPSPDLMNDLMAAMGTLLPILLVCAIPVMFLTTCWRFTLPVIMDKRVDFWTGMKTSWKMVMKHWWAVFGLLILISLLNLAGFLACCIGLLFTVPLGYAALIKAYETIFGNQKT